MKRATRARRPQQYRRLVRLHGHGIEDLEILYVLRDDCRPRFLGDGGNQHVCSKGVYSDLGRDPKPGGRRFLRKQAGSISMTTIVRNDDVRAGAPRIAGTRITVLDCKRRVIDEQDDPHVVAGEYGISMSDLFRALAYYYDNRDELAEREREFEHRRREGERRTRAFVTDENRIEEAE